MAQPLSEKPARVDLTDRECARIIGGLLGSLAGVAESIDALRNAVRWWADTDQVWTTFEKIEEENRKIGMSPPRG